MQAAARLGIPHSEFMGWPDHDRDLMLALGRVERNTGQYGEWIPEATSDRADLNYYGPDPVRFVPHGPFTNQAVKAVQDAQDAWKKAMGDDANLNGKFWTVENLTPGGSVPSPE